MSLSFFSKTNLLTSTCKQFYLASIKCSSKPVETKNQPPPTDVTYSDLLKKTHRPNKLEQKVLVWTGRFKSAAEVPDEVSHETMEKARNKARIKIANYMMVATVFGCIIMVISGKRAAERGESISKMNLDWHREINKESK